jgi:hypothetical protein
MNCQRRTRLELKKFRLKPAFDRDGAKGVGCPAHSEYACNDVEGVTIYLLNERDITINCVVDVK